MKMHTLSPAPGSRTAEKRIGRGIGSGLGKRLPKVTKVSGHVAEAA